MTNIKDLREEAGLTPTQLAALAGVSYQTAYKVEHSEPVTRVYVKAVLGALSEKLGRVIKESDVSGLAII
jgi:DNA-binding XRE family transcriptional regulator